MENPLIGKTLTAIYLADDKLAIKFELGTESIVAHCDADCCSNTWVEHVELPAKGFPAQVLAVENLDLPNETDEITHYGLKITTDRGELVIDYRNESNGYYGGNLQWPGEYFYGGVYGQNISTENWVEVKADI